MGSMYAAGFAEAVKEGSASLEQAITAQLRGNFYPPLPVAYVKPVIEAIGKCNEYEFEAEIVLPEDLNPLPRASYENADGKIVIAAGKLVEITRTEFFLDTDDDY